MENNTSVKCNNTCPVCCDETIEELNARTESNMRQHALILSSVIAIMLMAAHIWFAYVGKVLPIPDIAWALIMSPWIGAATGKLLPLIGKGGKNGL